MSSESHWINTSKGNVQLDELRVDSLSMTLRAKLLTTVLTLVTLALIVSDIASATALRTYLLDQLDNDLVEGRAAAARRIEITTTTPTTTPTTPAPSTSSTTSTTTPHHSIPRDNDQQLLNDFFVEVRSADGSIDDRLVPSVLKSNDPLPDISQAAVKANLDKGPFTVSAINKKHFRYRVVALSASDDRTIIVAVSLGDFYNAMQRLILAESVVTAGVLLSLGTVGWWIVRKELRPLDAMANTADAIAQGDLSQRVEKTNPKTEVGRLSEALNSMLTQIESSFEQQQASEERLRRFAADASHELRTPLTAIRGYAELYRQGAIVDDDHLARVLHRIEKEAARMGLIVEDLLLLARMDQNRPFENEQLDIVEVINEVVHDAEAVNSSHTITTSSTRNVILLNGDAARLHQVFANLVGNALSHTPSGTAITLETSVTDSTAETRVIDNGPGMDPQLAQHVFERFYRIDVGRSRETGGTGLGLSIVRSIVEKHGGTVEVQSKIGEGTTFLVRLPLTSLQP